jgi:hypothetical protein
MPQLVLMWRQNSMWWTLVLGFIRKVPIRYWEYLGLSLVLVVGILWYNHHEREIGRQQLEEKIEAAQKQAQAQIDVLTDKQNKDLQVRYDEVQYNPIAPLDLKLPTDCGAVPDDIRVRVNAAHKAGKG